MSNYWLADFAARINIGIKRGSSFVTVPYTKLIASVVWLLLENQGLRSFTVGSNKNYFMLEVILKLKFSVNKSVLTRINVISKPGLRAFVTLNNFNKIFKSHAFRGFFILSTSTGLRTSSEVLMQEIFNTKRGGEVLLSVYF